MIQTTAYLPELLRSMPPSNKFTSAPFGGTTFLKAENKMINQKTERGMVAYEEKHSQRTLIQESYWKYLLQHLE